ncbi:vancomycin permeability regulator SanA [Stackebrandtia endophytica]|uniref:Vancomycin permeability regulator SanA n=1 Tax=Stackebrandtia endophytica TaxID=1496996 RepID=A0A543AXS3_9ACTN|nr:vancomycin permeability regulator SanA [Stackebrandtia endophytica]
MLRWWNFRRLVILALTASLSVSAVIAAAGFWVHWQADDGRYTVDSVPAKPVVLVLGAQVYADGRPSAFLAARLDLGRRLYEDGKAQAILVSGDNGQAEYNEVDPMREYLIDAGVPEKQVVGDYAGFDTRDSCVRAKEVFGVTELIVVTQTFHLDRAIALCRAAGIDTVGVGDDTVSQYRPQWRYAVTREYLANVKAWWDVWLDVPPRFLGPYETGIDEALASLSVMVVVPTGYRTDVLTLVEDHELGHQPLVLVVEDVAVAHVRHVRVAEVLEL